MHNAQVHGIDDYDENTGTDDNDIDLIDRKPNWFFKRRKSFEHENWVSLVRDNWFNGNHGLIESDISNIAFDMNAIVYCLCSAHSSRFEHNFFYARTASKTLPYLALSKNQLLASLAKIGLTSQTAIATNSVYTLYLCIEIKTVILWELSHLYNSL